MYKFLLFSNFRSCYSSFFFFQYSFVFFVIDLFSISHSRSKLELFPVCSNLLFLTSGTAWSSTPNAETNTFAALEEDEDELTVDEEGLLDLSLDPEVRVSQGCMRTSSVVSRWVGSFRRRHRIRHLAREDTLSGRLKWPRRILANRPVCSWPWNGYLQNNNIY